MGMGKWAVLLVITVGLAAGLGGYTFRYAEGLSYFSTDPKACVNCHIMRPQYEAWQKSSHHAVAKCVECHLPESFIPKYIAKAENGYRHSKMFTLQNFQEPIFVQAAGQKILQDNCVRCHDMLVHDNAGGPHSERGELSCVHCHAGVAHGERAGLGGSLRRDESGRGTQQSSPKTQE